MKTIRLVFDRERLRDLKSSPSSGMSLSSGMRSIVLRSSSLSRPPIANISPSSTVSTVSNERLLMMRSLLRDETGPATLDTSWRRNSFTSPAPLTCGVTSSLMPTSSRWTVRKALSKLSLSASPVVIGTSCPTRNFAAWLSSVTICGVASKFDVVSDFTALMIAPKIVFLPISPTNPPKPPVAPSSEAAAAS